MSGVLALMVGSTGSTVLTAVASTLTAKGSTSTSTCTTSNSVTINASGGVPPYEYYWDLGASETGYAYAISPSSQTSYFRDSLTTSPLVKGASFQGGVIDSLGNSATTDFVICTFTRT